MTQGAEYFTFMLPPSIWSKNPYPSRFKMTVAYAADRYPGATPILSSREVRTPSSEITADAPYARGARSTAGASLKFEEWLFGRIGKLSERVENPPNEPS